MVVGIFQYTDCGRGLTVSLKGSPVQNPHNPSCTRDTPRIGLDPHITSGVTFIDNMPDIIREIYSNSRTWALLWVMPCRRGASHNVPWRRGKGGHMVNDTMVSFCLYGALLYIKRGNADLGLHSRIFSSPLSWRGHIWTSYPMNGIL